MIWWLAVRHTAAPAHNLPQTCTQAACAQELEEQGTSPGDQQEQQDQQERIAQLEAQNAELQKHVASLQAAAARPPSR